MSKHIESAENQPASVSVDNEREVVVLDADDYRNLMETFYLLRSPANAERLREGSSSIVKINGRASMLNSYLD